MNSTLESFPLKLYASWHPVGYSHEITSDKPFGTILLDEPVVIWRTSDGTPYAMRDLCIHRGTALSLGWIENDCLVCPYHAWQYNNKGSCVLIPQAKEIEIPSKAKTPRYHCQEKFGIIWVALKDPEFELPEVPEFENDNWKLVNTGPFNWSCDSSRQVENFTDFGHFPWVHPGLLGDPNRPEVPDCKVTVKGNVLHYTITRPEAKNSNDFPIFANENIVKPERISIYQLHLPYTIVLRLGWGGKKGMVYFFTSQPISNNSCRGFCIIGRNYNFNEPDTILQEFEKVIFDQDKRIVESQRPIQVPFDLSEELHLKFDLVAMNYRRAMKKNNFSY